jgi:predicted Rossmann fold flavoprotein
LKRIAIIGGGASGLMAACFASGNGNRVVVFERQKKIGRKILASGNGRCNITNRHFAPEKFHGSNPRFVHNVFSRFGFSETMEFFGSIGVPLIEESNGKLFPASLQASAVVRVFEYELAARNVETKLHVKVDRIVPAEGGLRLLTAGKESYDFDAVILSAGSCAYPSLGGSRSGYELAVKMGHTVHEPFPALLPITIPLKTLHRLQGAKWDCGVKVVHDSKIVASSVGEILFTAYGISGPVSLDVSREVNNLAVRNIFPDIFIDFFPGCAAGELSALLDSLWKDGSKALSFSLVGILKHPMPEVLSELAGIEVDKPVSRLTKEDKIRLVETLKGLKLTPGRPRGFGEAVVAAGGVAVDEVDPATMESRLAPGLHLTGELLDIDGDSGGYNLQFAWSTGAIAGLAQHRSR